MSKILTLTSDWNNYDYYTASVKASILSKYHNVNIIDISHKIPAFSIIHAAFILKAAYQHFPINTIHIICVDSEPDINENIVIAYYKSHYFIANDNGCLGIIFDELPDIVVRLETGFSFEGSSFIELNLFSDLAAFILKDGDITNLGKRVGDVKRLTELAPSTTTNTIYGEIIYIDSYQNAITNISKTLFYEHIKDSKFQISIGNTVHTAERIYNSYKQVDRGEIVCIFNTLDLLEIAMRGAKASQFLKLELKTPICINYNL